MYRLLVRLMFIAALAEFGMKVSDIGECRSRQCVKMLQVRALDVLRIDWKPISVFVRPDKGVFYRPHKDGLGPETAGSERGLRSSR